MSNKNDANFDVITQTHQFFEQAVPNVTLDNQNIQIGVHIEEFLEMLDEIEIPLLEVEFQLLKQYTEVVATALKGNKEITVVIKDRKALLDAMVDQLVTGTGVGYMLGMDVVGALFEVNRSNFSKFVDGQPVFNAQGKIAKGPNYSKPELSPFVGTDPVEA